MKGYFVTETEMQALIDKMRLAFLQEAKRHNQDIDTLSGAGQQPTIGDAFRTANYVVCTWRNGL